VAFAIPGLLLVTDGGIHFFALIDDYAANFNVMLLCLLELFAINGIYGEFLEIVRSDHLFLYGWQH